jgi:hypothetical protein
MRASKPALALLLLLFVTAIFATDVPVLRASPDCNQTIQICQMQIEAIQNALNHVQAALEKNPDNQGLQEAVARFERMLQDKVIECGEKVAEACK